MEVAGLVLGAVPLGIELLDYLTALRPTIRATSWTDDRWQILNQEYGLFSAVALLTLFKDAMHVMERVERHVLHGNDHEALVFKESIAGGFNLVAVAGAIVAQVAITALSLPRLNETHWTVQAFFIASLIFGSLSVFFSCIAHQAVNTLHGADDIKNWLSKPILSEQKRWFQQHLDDLENDIYSHAEPLGAEELGGEKYARLEGAINRGIRSDRWKAASFSSAVMLIAPARLLSLALNTFVAGLGIYLGLVYTANLIPILGSNGSLAVLICYILSTFYGLTLFYIPLGFKKLESLPVKRFTRLMHVVRSRQERSRRSREGPGSIAVNVPHSRGRADLHPEPSRNGVVGNLPLQEQTTPSPATQQGQLADASGLGESVRQHETLLANASSDHMPVPSTDRFQSALEAFVKAQERSVQAGQALLEECRAMRPAEI